MPLVSWYPLHGNAVDVRGNNDGTINGPIEASGILGTSALSFDGVDDYVDTGTNFSTLESTNFTISGWVKHQNDSSFRAMLVQRDSNDSGVWIGGDEVSGMCTVIINDSSGNSYSVSGENFNTNVWNHLVGTYNGSKLKIYVNGSLSNQTNVSITPIDITEPTYIGANQNLTRHHLEGDITDVRIYDHALTASEIQYLYETVRGQSSWTGEKSQL